jgi:hypothetical protein
MGKVELLKRRSTKNPPKMLWHNPLTILEFRFNYSKNKHTGNGLNPKY